jgi:hypothetical protein
MSIVRSPVRSVVRSPVRGVFGGADTQTDLQRLLALSPSLVIWPANGAGWQGTSGGTLAAPGQPLGLGADLSQLGGKTLGEWLAAPTTSELVTNGEFASDTAWSKGTGWTIIGGQAVATAISSSVLSQGASLVAGRVYRVTYTVSEYTSGSVRPIFAGGSNVLGNVRSAVGTYTDVMQAVTGNTLFRMGDFGAGFTGAVTNISVRELPGNHLRAGTWASPSDAARGTFQNNAINFNGSAHYYSLLNAISITESMTVVRAFKRASAGIRSAGLGATGTSAPRDPFWFTSNAIFQSLGGSGSSGSADTSTGSFVVSGRRNASTQSVRLNGAAYALSVGTAPAVSGSFDLFGRTNIDYNSGEISFLAVFPTELTGADLTLVEQIAAATNSAVLA